MNNSDYIIIGNKRFSNKVLSSHLESEIRTLQKRIDLFKQQTSQDSAIIGRFEEMIADRQQILAWINCKLESYSTALETD